MSKAAAQTTQTLVKPLAPAQAMLQKKCDCGNHTVAGGECAECAKNKSGLQRKVAIGASNDPMEQEADRVADQVMASSAHHVFTGAPLRIQRFSGQSNGQMDAAPSSVDQALSSPGRPLEPVLRQNMEQRFSYDFSRVRVHSGPVAEQSARDVNANAYTAGKNIVFGAGKFSPGTYHGRRLIAHELVHVVQQSKGIRVNQSDQACGQSNLPLSPSIEPSFLKSSMVLQRAPDDKPQEALGTDELIDEHVFGARVHEEVGDLRIRITKMESQLKANPNDAALKAKIDKSKLQLAVLEGKVTPATARTIKVPGVGSINTRAVIQIVDSKGNLIMLERGSWSPDEHAEENAISKLRIRLGNTKLPPGTKIIVGGNQVVCGERCEPALKQFAKDYGADSVDAFVKVRPKIVGTGMASAKTTERTRLREDVPAPEIAPVKKIYVKPPVPGVTESHTPDEEHLTPPGGGVARNVKPAGKGPTNIPGGHMEEEGTGGMGGVVALAVLDVIINMVASYYMQKYFAGKVKEDAQRLIKEALTKFDFPSFMKVHANEISEAQAEGREVQLQVSVDTTWQSTDIGNVLINAKVGDCQVILEEGPPPKPYVHEGKGGIVGDLLRSHVGTTLDQEVFKVPLEGTDPVAKHHRQSRKDIEKLRTNGTKQIEYEELILSSYSGNPSRDDLADYARYKEGLAVKINDKKNVDYWHKMYLLVVGPLEDVIIQAKIKSVPLDKFKAFALKQASGKGPANEYWGDITGEVDKPLPERYLGDRQRYLWTQPEPKDQLDAQKAKIAAMEKQLSDMEKLIPEMMKQDARTPAELRGNEPPHPPWSKINQLQEKIPRLKEDIDIEKQLLKEMDRKPPVH